MNYQIAVLEGDGVGPEIMKEAILLLKEIGRENGHTFYFHTGKIGGAALDESNEPLPERTLQLCKISDAVLLGAVGGPKWDHVKAEQRPEAGLLKLRKALGLFANIRPVQAYSSLLDTSPLKREMIENVDFVIVRELTGGIYFGAKQRIQTENGVEVMDTLSYTDFEIKRILREAFELANKRRKKLTSVDKANVLESSRVWRECANELSKEYPEVQLEHMLVDNAAMQIIKNPSQFDVIVTENMFGDILSDEASVITGSIGLLPSASLGNGPGLYEPIHGSAPDIAGQNIANPLAIFSSVALMLRYSLGLEKEARDVERAIDVVLRDGYRTKDISKEGERALTTSEMGEAVRTALVDVQVENELTNFYSRSR